MRKKHQAAAPLYHILKGMYHMVNPLCRWQPQTNLYKLVKTFPPPKKKKKKNQIVIAILGFSMKNAFK